eukprot:2158884-Alexandrium_andersonii.AAC.1
MSASLVGSEMCIRDRHCAAFSRRCQICRRHGPASTPEALARGCGTGGDPPGKARRERSTPRVAATERRCERSGEIWSPPN